MAKRIFNINGLCLPDRHYMVDLTERLGRIKDMIDNELYFCINRGRQYGKTTTLGALCEYLKFDYAVISLDFQAFDTEDFGSAATMTETFCRQFLKRAKRTVLAEGDGKAIRLLDKYLESNRFKFSSLSDLITDVCEVSPKPVVLLIDEVDQASNFEVFAEFLSLLRLKYLDRNNDKTFQSVILAGVHDIRHLKSKIRPDSEHKLNSPWNIAAPFEVEMGFRPDEIAGMLRQYEADHNTGMDADAVARTLYEYTSGYPVMVSWLCRHIDEKSLEWSAASVGLAVKALVNCYPMVDVFGSMVNQLGAHEDIDRLLETLVFNGVRVNNDVSDNIQSLGMMFGYLKAENGGVKVANRVFEMFLVNRYTNRMTTFEIYSRGEVEYNRFVKDGKLDMDLVLRRYAAHYAELYSDKDQAFVEAYGRKLFVLYVKPILNGVGNYYIEAQTRDATRTDLIIDYKGQQFVVEMKIWHGESYNERGEAQLAEYLDYYKLSKGYMLSYNFNKNKPKDPVVQTVKVGGREILEAVV